MLAHRDHLGDQGLTAKRATSSSTSPGRWCATSSSSGSGSAERPAVRDEVRDAVLSGELPATVAADRILAAYDDASG